MQQSKFLSCPIIQKCISTTEVCLPSNQRSVQIMFKDVYIRLWLLGEYNKDVYIRPWLLRVQNTRKNITGCIYMSLVAKVQLRWSIRNTLEDVYIRPWLLQKKASALKGLKYNIIFCSSNPTFPRAKIFKMKLS